MADIWEAFDRMSAEIHKADRIEKKKEQIANVCSRTCGNCDHWMKTTCVPEKQHKQFKSSSSMACGAFEMCGSSLNLKTKFEAELLAERTTA
jgi:hypothetical protein